MKNLLNSQLQITLWLLMHGVKNYKLIKDKEYGFVVDVKNTQLKRVGLITQLASIVFMWGEC